MDTTWNNQCVREEKSAGFFTAKPVLSQGYHIETLDKQDTLKGRSQMSHMFTLESLINKERLVPRCFTLMRNDSVAMTMFMHQIRFQGDDNARFLGEKSVVINGKRFTHSLQFCETFKSSGKYRVCYLIQDELHHLLLSL